MCNEKPGNRCSHDAGIALEKATNDLTVLMRKSPGEEGVSAETAIAATKFRNAVMDYNSTRRGMKELEAEAKDPDISPMQKRDLEQQLEDAKTLHAARKFALAESSLTSDKKLHLRHRTRTLYAQSVQNLEKLDDFDPRESVLEKAVKGISSEKKRVAGRITDIEKYIRENPTDRAEIKKRGNALEESKARLVMQQELRDLASNQLKNG